MILSIIVPIYNASKYLHRCIDSLLAQGLKEGEYEIFLINDGSKDESLNICKEYQNTYPSIIKVLSHDNQGVSYTRNRGIDEAQGDYICFVDADDYLKPNGYRYLIDNYLEEHIDILSFWALTLDKKTKANYIENNDIEGKICYEVKGRDFLKNGVQTFIWSSLYRRSLLIKEQLRFSNLTIGEDILFNLNVYMKDPTIRSVSSRIYLYDLHEESTIHQRNYPAMRKAINSYYTLFLETQELYECNNEDIALSQGLKNIRTNQFIPFLSRLLSSDYTISELKALKIRLHKSNILPVKRKDLKGFVINFVFQTPFLFPIYKWGYQHIFIPYILPYLSRN